MIKIQSCQNVSISNVEIPVNFAHEKWLIVQAHSLNHGHSKIFSVFMNMQDLLDSLSGLAHLLEYFGPISTHINNFWPISTQINNQHTNSQESCWGQLIETVVDLNKLSALSCKCVQCDVPSMVFDCRLV